jgi:hypothetical protein
MFLWRRASPLAVNTCLLSSSAGMITADSQSLLNEISKVQSNRKPGRFLYLNSRSLNEYLIMIIPKRMFIKFNLIFDYLEAAFENVRDKHVYMPHKGLACCRLQVLTETLLYTYITYTKQVTSQILTAASMKMTASWDTAPCSVVEVDWRFCLHHQGLDASWSLALMMEAVRTSETSANFYETTRGNIPEGCHLHESDSLTYSTEHSPYWEASSRSSGQEIPRLL